jgi:hypothetical protein
MREMRDDIAALLSDQLGMPCPSDLLHRFLKHFVLVQFDYLHEGAKDSAAAVDSVRAALPDAGAGEAPKLLDALCRIAREGAGRSQQFSRVSLVSLVSRTFRLGGAPSLRTDLSKLSSLTRSWVLDISDDVRGTRLDRPQLAAKLDEVLARTGLRSISVGNLLPSLHRLPLRSRPAPISRVGGACSKTPAELNVHRPLGQAPKPQCFFPSSSDR